MHMKTGLDYGTFSHASNLDDRTVLERELAQRLLITDIYYWWPRPRRGGEGGLRSAFINGGTVYEVLAGGNLGDK